MTKTKNIRRKVTALICCAMFAVSSVAVVGVNAATVSTVEVEATSLTLNVKSLNLGKGETYKLKANKTASFKTSDKNVATVDKNGKITAKNNGTATITATSGKQTATCKVTVKNAPASISLNKTSLTLGVGETFDLNSSLPKGTASRSIVYTSDNTKVASVKAAGGLTTATGVGSATITAKTFNGKTVTCKVTVKNAPDSVSLNKTSMTLGVGETFDLDSKLPAGTASRVVTYKSSNSKVASVKSVGGLTTAKATGTATITATTFNGKTATCKVTVKKAPTSISLNQTSLTLGVGETYDLNSSLPKNTASRSIVYSSNNTSVASVKAAGGMTTAKGVGTATITATTFNGKTATCKVTVKKAPDSVSLNKTELTIGIGETFDLNSKLPSGTASRSVVYTSSNPSVATVKTAGGLVTAKAKGTATITATTFNGKTATCTVNVPGTWHEAEYKTVTEKVKVVDEEAYTYEKEIYTYYSLCKGCIDKASELAGYRIWDLPKEEYYIACREVGVNPSLVEIVLTDLGYNPDDYTVDERKELYVSLKSEGGSEAFTKHLNDHLDNDENDGYFDSTFIVGYETVTVPEEYHYETVTKKVLVKEAGYY